MEPDEQALNDQLNGREPQEVEIPEVEEQDQEIETPEVEASEVEHDDEPEEKPLTRGQQRIQNLANEKAEAKREADLAKQEALFLRSQLEAIQRARQQPEVEEDLDPNVKWQREANQVIQRNTFQTADMLDKAEFTMEVAQKPAYAALRGDVEKRLQQFRMNGGNPTRKQVLTVIMGEQAMAKAEKAPVLRKEAAARVKAAQGTPLRTSSNVAPASKASQSTYERLKDIQI